MSHYDRHHQDTEKGPARQRKSLVVILHLPKRKKSLTVTLHLPKQMYCHDLQLIRTLTNCNPSNEYPRSSELATRDEGNFSSSGRVDDCRTDIAAEQADERKKRRRRLCSDLINNDAAYKDKTAEMLCPSPISIQSTTDNSTWTTQQSPVLSPEATKIAVPANEDSGEPSMNQAVTQSTMDRDLTLWTLRPPVIPINIYESGHPLFVVTGNTWLDSMP